MADDRPFRHPPAASGPGLARIARLCFRGGCRAVHPRRLMAREVQARPGGFLIGDQLWQPDRGGLVVVGAGKASAAMAIALLDRLGRLGADPAGITGHVNVPDRDAASAALRIARLYQRHARQTATHPANSFVIWPCRGMGDNLPTARAVEGTAAIVQRLSSLAPDDLGVALISGGGSALLTMPAPPLTLDDKRCLVQWLDRSGADIADRNRVRRELSGVKGGRLGQRAAHSRLVTFVLSDILGDPLDLIASGPTVPSPSDPDGALAILRRLAGGDPVRAGVPAAVVELLAGRAAQRAGIGDIDDEPLRSGRHSIHLAGNLAMAAAAAAAPGRRSGWSVAIRIQDDPEESVQAAARRIVHWIADAPPGPQLLIDAGEPVIRLDRQPGAGGRNQQLVLAASLLLWQMKDVRRPLALLSAGTDGEDGNTAVAGGIVDSTWLRRFETDAAAAADALARFDAGSFLKQRAAVVDTGPTGTNVGDLRVVVLG